MPYSGSSGPYSAGEPTSLVDASLGELDNVDTSGKVQGSTLHYDTTISKWKANSVLKIDDTNETANVAGHLNLTRDGDTIALGNERDFQIYHDGTNTEWINGYGDLIVRQEAGDTLMRVNGGKFKVQDTDPNDILVVDTTNQRLGVGTTTPEDSIHIEGVDADVSTTQLTLEGRYNGYGAGVDFVSRTSSGGTRASMAKITADGESSWDTTPANQNAGLRFFTTTAGTQLEKMRISNNGDVGIGTTPSTRLHAYGSQANPLLIERNASATNCSMECKTQTDSVFFGINGNDNACIGHALDQTNAPFQITSGGNVGIGLSPVVPLDVKTTGLGNGGFLCNFNANGSTTSNSLKVARYTCGSDNDRTGLYFQNEGVFNTRFWIDDVQDVRISSANPTANDSGTVVGTQTSDRRLKNVNGVLDLGLNEILKLNPVRYSLKADKKQKERLGFIAQEAKEVIPQSVYDTKEIFEGDEENTLLAMDYTTIIPVLVNAVKELKKQVEELKALTH
jgi:hypothetical protein